jgi:vacuolar-type H+-ATPase subunit I/STV1
MFGNFFTRTKKQVIDDETVGALVNEKVEAVQDGILCRAIDGAVDSVRKILEEEESVIRLKKQKSELEEQVSKLKSKAKIEETEIKTLIKVAEEKKNLELERKELELMKQFQQQEVDMVKQYHTDLAKAVDKERNKMETFMTKVMDQFQGRDIQVIK